MKPDLTKWINDTLITLEKHRSDNKVLVSNNPGFVKSEIHQHLPESGRPFSKVLQDFENHIIPFLNLNSSPNYAAYITGSGNPVGAVAEFIKGYYNQNGLKWNNSPIAAELEQLVIQWISIFCMVPEYNQGVLTSGGSMSNLLALHFALAKRLPSREQEGLFHESPLTVYCSEEAHSSIERAMVFLGLGRNQLRKIPVDGQFRIRPDLLEEAIEKDVRNGFSPLAMVGTAGTTNTGSIDPLDKMGELAKAHGLWFHVDGAYGLPAIRIPYLANKFQGIDMADSIVVNPHKWMYVPFEASCILMKKISKAIHFQPNYLLTDNPGERWESSEHTIELSKEFRALKIWFTFTYYGADELTRFVKNDIDLTQYLADQLVNNSFEIAPYQGLSILCFRYVNENKDAVYTERVNQKMVQQIETNGIIFLTGTQLYEKTYLRIYFGNPERSRKNVDEFVTVLLNTLHEVSP